MTHMINGWSVFKTGGNNRYFYDKVKQRAQLCHPLLHYILELYKKGTDPVHWVAGLEGDTVEIDDLGRFSKTDVEYYVQKFLLLKENGYFGRIDLERRLSGRITKELIERTLANVTQVTFEVTDRCNLKCKYCGYGEFYDDYDQREGKDLPVDSAKRLLDHLLKYWNSPLNQSHDRNIFFSFYGGEPLMNITFLREIVAYVNDLGLMHNPFTFNMTTNGLLLKKHMHFLVEHRFKLLISLDGNEENNDYRVTPDGKPAFRLIMENIDALLDTYPDYFEKYVNFNSVLHNKNSVDDIYGFIKSRYGKIPSIGPLNNTGIRKDRQEEFWATYRDFGSSLQESGDRSAIEKDMFIKLPNVTELAVFLFENNHFTFEDYNDMLFPKKDNIWIPTGTCIPFSKKVFVTAHGKILPCETCGHQHALGHLSPTGVQLDSEAIAARYNQYFDKMKRLCTACHQIDRCKQCIFQLDTLDDEKPVCTGIMSEKHYAQAVSRLVSSFEKNPILYHRLLKEVNFE